MGILIEGWNKDIEGNRLAWDRYRSYLDTIRDRLPSAAREFAEAAWHYDPADHRCPHDSWVERILISEPAKGNRRERRRIDIQVQLLGAYHDRHIEFTYRNVVEYCMEQPNRPEDRGYRQWVGHGDWLIDEVGLSKHGLITHEVCFRWGGTWYIECEDFSYEWLPVVPNPETLVGEENTLPTGAPPVWKKNMNRKEVAQLIERFLESRSRYPQEWNDFVDTPQKDSLIENYRRQCYELDPLVNLPGVPDPDAVARLKDIIDRLRSGGV